MTSAHVTEKYNLGPVKSWVYNAGYLLGNMFGIGTEYGWRQSDPFPDHPSGHAIDFMISDLDQGERLKDYAVANHTNLGIKYIIFNHRWYGPQNNWQGAPYTATTNPHTDHVHITFLDSPGAWTSTFGFQPTTGGATTTADATLTAADTCFIPIPWPSANASVGGLNLSLGGGSGCFMSKSQARFIMGGMFIAGGAFVILVGAAFLTAYGLKKTGALKIVPGMVRNLV